MGLSSATKGICSPQSKLNYFATKQKVDSPEGHFSRAIWLLFFMVTWTLSFILPLSYYAAVCIVIHGACNRMHSSSRHLQVILRTASAANLTLFGGTLVKLSGGLCKTCMSKVLSRRWPSQSPPHHSYILREVFPCCSLHIHPPVKTRQRRE